MTSTAKPTPATTTTAARPSSPAAWLLGLLKCGTAWRCWTGLLEADERSGTGRAGRAAATGCRTRRGGRAPARDEGKAVRPRRSDADDAAAAVVDLSEIDDALVDLARVRPYDPACRGIHRRCVAVVARALQALAPHGITADALRAVARHRWERFERDGRPWLDLYAFRFVTKAASAAAA